MDQPSATESIAITMNAAPARSCGPNAVCEIGESPPIGSPCNTELAAPIMRSVLRSFQLLKRQPYVLVPPRQS